MRLLEAIRAEFAYRRRVHGPRVDGVTATEAGRGWFTRHRRDLPFPT
jgi:hypothetical protein